MLENISDNFDAPIDYARFRRLCRICSSVSALFPLTENQLVGKCIVRKYSKGINDTLDNAFLKQYRVRGIITPRFVKFLISTNNITTIMELRENGTIKSEYFAEIPDYSLARLIHLYIDKHGRTSCPKFIQSLIVLEPDYVVMIRFQQDFDITKRDYWGVVILTVNEDIITMIFGILPNWSEEISDIFDSAFTRSVALGSLHACKLLLDKGYPIDEGFHIHLVEAAQAGHEELCAYFYARGADLDD